MERPERYVFHMTDGTDSTARRDLGELGHDKAAGENPERPAGKGERLAMAIRSRYRSTADFAREAGIPEGLVRQHIHRSTIPSKYLPTYTRFLKQSADWLLEGRGPAVIEPFAGTGATLAMAEVAKRAAGIETPKDLPGAGFDVVVGSPPYAVDFKKRPASAITPADYEAYAKGVLMNMVGGLGKSVTIALPPSLDPEKLRAALPGVNVRFVEPPEIGNIPIAWPGHQPEGGETPAAEALVGDRDLPVYGVAQGGAGALQIDASPIEYVKRPAPLMGVTGAFAVYVVGDSMSPAYEQGDLLLIHPGKPIERGLDALLTDAPEHGEWRAIVKRVDNWTEKVWRLTQFNPKKSYEVSKSEFPKAFRIVGKYNRR